MADECWEVEADAPRSLKAKVDLNASCTRRSSLLLSIRSSNGPQMIHRLLAMPAARRLEH